MGFLLIFKYSFLLVIFFLTVDYSSVFIWKNDCNTGIHTFDYCDINFVKWRYDLFFCNSYSYMVKKPEGILYLIMLHQTNAHFSKNKIIQTIDLNKL